MLLNLENKGCLSKIGVNINMERYYTCTYKQEQAVDKKPFNIVANTTILPSVWLDGRTTYIVYLCRTTA